jgi:kinetochore protein NDC80
MAVGMIVDRPSAVGVGLDIRRSSAFGTTKPGGPKQDPRPLASKDYQNSCIRTVISYLSTHNFPAAVSPKTLASPTGKDFCNIITFLFQQFDPTFKIQTKVEDEVPQFFKRLNYPFQISKSALFAVGSPHSWPAVLAAITWLVELLNYIEKAEDNNAPAFERENKVSVRPAPGPCGQSGWGKQQQCMVQQQGQRGWTTCVHPSRLLGTWPAQHVLGLICLAYAAKFAIWLSPR